MDPVKYLSQPFDEPFYLWRANIPTLEEYGQWTSAQAMPSPNGCSELIPGASTSTICALSPSTATYCAFSMFGSLSPMRKRGESAMVASGFSPTTHAACETDPITKRSACDQSTGDISSGAITLPAHQFCRNQSEADARHKAVEAAREG